MMMHTQGHEGEPCCYYSLSATANCVNKLCECKTQHHDVTVSSQTDSCKKKFYWATVSAQKRYWLMQKYQF